MKKKLETKIKKHKKKVIDKEVNHLVKDVNYDTIPPLMACYYIDECKQNLEQVCYTNFQKCIIYQRMEVLNKNKDYTIKNLRKLVKLIK